MPNHFLPNKSPFKDLKNFVLVKNLKQEIASPSFSHSVSIYEKKKKIRKLEINEDDWYVKVVINLEVALMELIAQEYLRLLIPGQPKTRIIIEFIDEGANYYIISKKIPNCESSFFNKEDYYKYILSGQVKNLAKVLIGSLIIDEVDLKAGNIVLSNLSPIGKAFKIDGGFSFASINPDYKEYMSEGKGDITEEDVIGLPNVTHFHAYNWLDFVISGHNQDTFEKLIPILNNPYFNSPEFRNSIDKVLETKQFFEQIDSMLTKAELSDFPLLDFFLGKWDLAVVEKYYSKETSQKLSCLLNNPYLKSREFQINLDSALNNYLVYEDMKCELSSILSDSELPNFDLLDFFLQKWTKKQVENNLNLIKKHADISSYEPFIKERNQAILASSLLSETILYKFTRSYVSEKDDKGKALTDKLAQTLIKRQKQILQEAYKIESFCSYVKSVAAQDDLLATINYLAEFKTTSKSFLLTKEQKKELLKKFIRGYAPICEFADQIGIYIATKKEINTKNSNKLFTFFRGKEQKKKKIELAQFLHAVLEEYLENPAFNQLRNVLEELNVVKHALLTTLELREKTNFVSAVSEIIKILTPFVDNTLPNNPLLSVAIDTQKNASLQPCKQQFFKKTKEFTEKPSMLVTQQFHFK